MHQDVKDFQIKFDQLTPENVTHLTLRKLQERREFMQEELDEFSDAMIKQDMALMADSLVDLVYVALGTAIMLGLPWTQLWDDVHRANMAKVLGTTHRGNKKDVSKPPGWEPPNTDMILALAKYRRKDFEDENGTVDEELCLDDPEYS